MNEEKINHAAKDPEGPRLSMGEILSLARALFGMAARPRPGVLGVHRGRARNNRGQKNAAARKATARGRMRNRMAARSRRINRMRAA